MQHAIKNEFQKKNKLTITEIYQLTANALNKNNDKKFQHSVRGAMYQLSKNNYVKRISLGLYILNE